jgi:hypothetical protein
MKLEITWGIYEKMPMATPARIIKRTIITLLLLLAAAWRKRAKKE